MAKQRVAPTDARAISKRLDAFALKHFGSWGKFIEMAGVKRTTAATWRRGKASAVPDAAMLLQLARTTNIDLNWLLMEKGVRDVWVEHDPNVDRQLEGMIEAVLRATESATEEDFRAVWGQLKVRTTTSQPEDAILQLAVSGVRSRFQEQLRRLHDYTMIFKNTMKIFAMRGSKRVPYEPTAAELLSPAFWTPSMSGHQTYRAPSESSEPLTSVHPARNGSRGTKV